MHFSYFPTTLEPDGSIRLKLNMLSASTHQEIECLSPTLSYLENKNARFPVEFEFQMNNYVYYKYIPNTALDIFIIYKF